jgi:hypothetical protein
VFDLHNAPVPARELEGFTARVAAEIDRVQPDPGQAVMTVVVDRGDNLEKLTSPSPGHPTTLAQLDQLLARRRRMVAMVTVTGWSPDPTTAIAPAWVLVAVGRGSTPARVAVRRIDLDRDWTDLPPHELPWFALSTASGLRAAIDHGQPLRIKQDPTEALYHRPDEHPDPPTDDRGEL